MVAQGAEGILAGPPSSDAAPPDSAAGTGLDGRLAPPMKCQAIASRRGR